MSTWAGAPTGSRPARCPARRWPRASPTGVRRRSSPRSGWTDSRPAFWSGRRARRPSATEGRAVTDDVAAVPVLRDPQRRRVPLRRRGEVPARPEHRHARRVAPVPVLPHEPPGLGAGELVPRLGLPAVLRRGAAHRHQPGAPGRGCGMTSNRIPARPGEVLDRTRRLPFHWNGTTHHGHPGDTIASALAAAGVRVFSRSLKYHRPRGLLTADGFDPGCLVQVGDEPNVRGAHRRLEAGMEVRSQNTWPSLRYDLRAV